MNKGKSFETRFQHDWLQTVPDSFVMRLPDQQSGYHGSSANPCDFICYSYPNMYLLELKSHKGNTFPLSAFRQYEKLASYDYNEGIKVGVILWLYDHDKVIYIPISTFVQLVEENKKSFNIKYLETKEYECYELPSEKLRTFMSTDYSFLVKLAEDKVI